MTKKLLSNVNTYMVPTTTGTMKTKIIMKFVVYCQNDVDSSEKYINNMNFASDVCCWFSFLFFK